MITAAILSATFAGITAILSKCGMKKTDSEVATALRTTVVLAFAWIAVFITGAHSSIPEINGISWLFLILSGLATGASWICYNKALSLGEVSKVAAVDKSSVVLSVLFAVVLFADERKLWWLKLIFLALIAVGTYLMTDVKRDEKIGKNSWLAFAFLSAVFAAATSVLAKIGIKNVDSNAATAIRTCVVFVAAWLIVIFGKKAESVKNVDRRELLFLVLSGIATGASWLLYYYAISTGQVSVVVPIDKLSILVTIAFSVTVLKEKLSLKAWIGLAFLTAGTICMAIFT